jgi:hypothetical protein
MSYPLFAICDVEVPWQENVEHLRQDCQEKDIVCGDQFETDALAGVNTIQETP